MKKEMNNKGFSLVELIIVIAIMAVLVGILAPQYLKYVNNSKVSTDVTNAQEMATAFNTAIADSLITANGKSLADLCTAAGIAQPVSKFNASATWNVTYTVTSGVSMITLTVPTSEDGEGTYEMYPNPDNNPASGTKGVNLTRTNGGLKK